MRRITVRRAMVAVLVACMVAFGASLVPFVWPTDDPAGHADAIVVLSGDHGERLALGLRMIKAGVASTLVLAGKPDTKAVARLCQGAQAFEVICLQPADDSTRNEARATAQLAAGRGWRRLVVATSNFHVYRSRLLFGRCGGAKVSVVGAEPAFDLRTRLRVTAHEWLGTAQALTLERGC